MYNIFTYYNTINNSIDANILNSGEKLSGIRLDNRELKMRRFCQHGRRPEVNHAVVDDDSRS